VTLTATVTAAVITGKPGGTVTYKDGATTLGTASLVNGVASFTWTNPAASAHALTAVYGGGGSLQASTSAAVTVTVGKWATKLATPWLSNANPTAGSPVTLYASLNILSTGATATPGGTITFKDGATVLARDAQPARADRTGGPQPVGRHALDYRDLQRRRPFRGRYLGRTVADGGAEQGDAYPCPPRIPATPTRRPAPR